MSSLLHRNWQWLSWSRSTAAALCKRHNFLSKSKRHMELWMRHSAHIEMYQRKTSVSYSRHKGKVHGNRSDCVCSEGMILDKRCPVKHVHIHLYPYYICIISKNNSPTRPKI